MQSKATTVADYLKELPPERRRAIQAVRRVISQNLPKGYQEIMQYGMISYVVPLTRYPSGYLENPSTPLPFASLASQKNYMSLYLMNIYGHPQNEKWFTQAYKKSGKKLNMGKSCVRFKKLEDLPLDVIGQAIARTSPDEHIKHYEQSRTRSQKKKN